MFKDTQITFNVSAWRFSVLTGRYLLFVALTFAFTACGFHLRGEIKLDPRYLPVKVEDSGVNAEIKPRLVRHLTEANIPVVEKGDAHLLIMIEDVSFEKHLVSAASQANIDTFDIGVKMHYKFSVDGDDIMKWQELRINRTLQFSKSAVVSSATEEATLRDDLLSDAVNQIITRLRYLDTLVGEAPKKLREAPKNEPKT